MVAIIRMISTVLNFMYNYTNQQFYLNMFCCPKSYSHIIWHEYVTFGMSVIHRGQNKNKFFNIFIFDTKIFFLQEFMLI